MCPDGKAQEWQNISWYDSGKETHFCYCICGEAQPDQIGLARTRWNAKFYVENYGSSQQEGGGRSNKLWSRGIRGKLAFRS